MNNPQAMTQYEAQSITLQLVNIIFQIASFLINTTIHDCKMQKTEK